MCVSEACLLAARVMQKRAVPELESKLLQVMILPDGSHTLLDPVTVP